MEYTYLGNTGLEVSRLCLGTMMFSSRGITAAEPSVVIGKAIDHGINFIDSADIYGSEEIIGESLRGRRDQFIVATKFKIRTEPGPNGQGASRHRIISQVEKSLKRLQTDYIDLYQIHRPDPNTAIEETMRALDDLVRQGKVRYIGCSNFDGWRIAESLWVSERMNLERFVSNQPAYSLFDRRIDQEILPVSRKYGLSTLCYSPLNSGWLSGKYNGVDKAPEGSRGAGWDLQTEEHQIKLWKVEQLRVIAQRNEITLSQLALSWLLHLGKDIIPVIGTKTLQQLDENIGALNVILSAEDLQEIGNICPSPFHDHSK